MKKALLIGLLSLAGSCAFMSDMHFANYNYDYIQSGENISSVIEKRGNPPQIYSEGNKKIYLYRDGFVRFENDQVVSKGLYQYFLSSNDSLSGSIRNGESVIDVLPKLGLPRSVVNQNGDTKFYFNRGAILVRDSKVVVSVDKTYSDLVFDIAINAYSDNSADIDGQYYVVPGSEKVNPEDFQFKEVKQMISSALELQGFKITQNPSNAKYLVMVNYGISDPKEDIQVISRPVYVPSYMPGNNFSFYGANGAFIGGMSSAGRWSSQYAGQHTETIKKVTYNRWMNIEAIDFKVLKDTKTMKPVWKVLTNSVGSTGDLRYVIPVLTYGTSNFLNKDTKRSLDFRVQSATLNDFVYESSFSSNPVRSLAGKK